MTATSPAISRASQTGTWRGRLGAERLRQHRQPLAHRGGLVVDDVVDRRAIVFEREHGPDRGPLLIISGEKDNTVPWAIANASYKKQKRNQAVTEIVEMPNRGHALVIDSGWREVADTALAFIQRFV